MKRIVGIFLRYVLPFGLAVLFMWLILKDIDEEKQEYIINSLRSADYRWIALSMVIAIISHWVRAMRWKMLLEPLGYKPSTANTFWSVMVAYIANLALPRMGEISRCGALKKTDNIPIGQSLGTVVTERVIDLLAFAVVFILTFAINSKFIIYLFNKSATGEGSGLAGKITIAVVVLIAAVIGFRYVLPRLKHLPPVEKAMHFFGGIWEGLRSVFKLANPGYFIFLTALIWFLYYLMMLFVTHAMDATSQLGFNGSLLVLTIGTLGFIAPVQGGFGAYHGVIIWLLTNLSAFAGTDVYSGPQLTEGDSISFAFLAHTSQTILVIVVGLFALFAVFIYKPKKNDLEGNHQ